MGIVRKTPEKRPKTALDKEIFTKSLCFSVGFPTCPPGWRNLAMLVAFDGIKLMLLALIGVVWLVRARLATRHACA